MRIAQIAPLAESVPPRLYGGTERIVSWLTEELVAMGHEVTLFASGDSQTSAKLEAMWPRALRLDPEIADPFAPMMLMVDQVAQRLDEFDVVHSHIDYLALPVMSRMNLPFVTTLHGRLNLPEYKAVLGNFKTPFVSISDSQRLPAQHLAWIGTVLHGMPANLLTPPPAPKLDYLAFLGRVSPEKRVDRAIEIAARIGMKIRIAAKIDNADRAYYESVIKPLFALPHVEYIGEIGDHQKAEFLGNAAAMMFPIDWPEPFGIVMIEAMACGTPVLAFRNGSVPEVIEDGITGAIVDTMDEAVAAMPGLLSMSRAGVRERFESRWTSRRMAEDYLAIYEALQPVRRTLRVVGA